MLSRRTKRAILGFVFAAGLIAVILISTARYFAALEEKRRYLEEKASLVPRAPQVHFVAREDRERTQTLSATLDPWQRASLAPEVSGRITAMKVEIGDRVARDQPLVEIDSQVAAAALAAAEARVAENRRLLEESRTLAQRNVAARTELEAASARLAISEAELQQARESLALHTLRAPFDGYVAARYGDPGDAARPGSPLLDVVDVSKLRVVFHVAGSEVAAFQPGVQVAVRPAMNVGPPLTAAVAFVAAAADEATRQFRVEAVLDPVPENVRPGQQATVAAVVARFRDTLFVPTAAVRIAGGKAYVVKTDPRDTSRREVVEIVVGPEVDGMYGIIEGLSEGAALLIQ